METLRPLTIEETYELTDAIASGNLEEVKEELGDVMLHLVFYSKIASETNDFDITDVLESVCDKLIRRHPHIYGDVKAESEEEVKKNWEKLKLKEGKKSILQGVPDSLPSVVKATRIQEKVKQVGFDWEHQEQVWKKVQEELDELKEAVDSRESEGRVEEELGDTLFALINYARFLGVNPDNALTKTNLKFMKRFRYIEEKAKAKNADLKEMSLEEMEAYWQESKATL